MHVKDPAILVEISRPLRESRAQTMNQTWAETMVVNFVFDKFAKYRKMLCGKSATEHLFHPIHACSWIPFEIIIEYKEVKLSLQQAVEP
jgi:hypothetical protein